jgi:murein DD-endopeptidase MepM/ murein hydrolase activator NlpD
LGKLRNAIDFIVDEKTPVLAAADGVVAFVDDSSNTGDPIQSIGVIQASL